MTSFRAFLDALDSAGGHLFLLLFVCAGGAAFSAIHIPHGEDILHDSFIALLAILGSKRLGINANADSNVQVNQSPNESKQENKT